MNTEAFEHELHPDEDQDRREAVVEVDEAVYKALQRELEGPESQDDEGATAE